MNDPSHFGLVILNKVLKFCGGKRQTKNAG